MRSFSRSPSPAPRHFRHEGSYERSSSWGADSAFRRHGGTIVTGPAHSQHSRRPRNSEPDLDLRVLIDPHELGNTFYDLPIEDDQLIKHSKKIRPYYERLARIRDQYQEVDRILSSALPSTIATSFLSHYTRNNGNGGMESNDIGANLAELKRERDSRTKRHVRTDSDQGATVDLGELGEQEPLLPHLNDLEEKREKRNRLMLNVNFLVNIILLGGKGVAMLSSNSVSLVASFVDALLDFVSTLIILVSNFAMGRKGDQHKYPAGKKRFEPLGVLVFSVTMIASFFQVFIESCQRALNAYKGGTEIAEISWLGIGTMIATIVVKSIIWVWCSSIPSTAVRALAQDAENDVLFNILSLGFPWLGTLLGWNMLDPIGGMVLSAYIIWQWCQTLHENFINLSGRAADGEEQTRILYLVSRFKPVLQISYCEIYHLGDELVVEVDVILPHNSTLHYAHDATETLQGLIESLDGVGRAYVHADYSSQNPAQHKVADSRNDKSGNNNKTKPQAKAQAPKRMTTLSEDET